MPSMGAFSAPTCSRRWCCPHHAAKVSVHRDLLPKGLRLAKMRRAHSCFINEGNQQQQWRLDRARSKEHLVQA